MRMTIDPTSMDSYRDFLKIKSLPFYRFRGHEAEFPNEYANIVAGGSRVRSKGKKYHAPEWMFDYQAGVTEMAIAKKKFCAFIDCGFGKSNIFLEFMRYALAQLPKSKRGLIISPLMVIKQTMAECERFFGDKVRLTQIAARDLRGWLLGDGTDRIGITNYEALEDDLPQGCLGCLVVDECFAPGTLIDTVHNGVLVQKGIEDIRIGDKIKNAYGIDRVIRTKKREVTYAYTITAGTRITCSPNHPFFTQRGWVCAQDLEPRDSVLTSRAAVRMVRGEVSAQRHFGAVSILRKILLSEMADESTGALGQSAYGGDARKNRQGEIAMVEGGKQDLYRTVGANYVAESDEQSRSSSEGIEDIESHEPQTFRAWWQREGLDLAAEDFAGCVGAELGAGICVIAGPTNSRISDVLQDRLRKSPLAQNGGREKRSQVDFVRVESIEILECGHPELERCRDADGKLYFYDLECARHPSFSVNGLLVHNSSYLKSHYGKWGTTILDIGRGLEWKMAATGTPAPNDRIEYANHAVFMDAFPNVNSFLARFFINRGQTQERWELRPHALEAFYRALSHWSIFMTNPATYGWKDNAANIPPINVQIHDVEMTDGQRGAVYDATGQLFVTRSGGITKRSKLAQIGKGFVGGVEIGSLKPAFIKRLAESWPDKSTIIWCHYNQEQEQLAKMIPEAANITGTTPYEVRQRLIDEFKAGARKILLTKPRILGFGQNLQIVTKMIFSTIQDSWEEYYQAVKRANRVGSTESLDVHIPITEVERPMADNVLRKAAMIQRDTAEQERIFKANAVLAV